MLITALVSVGCLCLGLYLGRGSRTDLRAELAAALAAAQADDAPAARHPPEAARCPVPIDPAMVRTEVARALAGLNIPGGGADLAGTAAPQPESEPKAPSPAEVAASAHARATLDGALSRRRMNKQEVRDLRETLATLDPKTKQSFTEEFVRSMNQDKLQLEDHELPF